MKAFITVMGADTKGIVAKVSGALYEMSINILDITQTVMQDNFVMIVLVDMTQADRSFADVNHRLLEVGDQLHMSVRLQRQDIFQAMHRI